MEMTRVDLTLHAEARTSQRGIRASDLDLLHLIGLPVQDGFLATDTGCEELERQCKNLLERLRHVRGKRMVVCSGRVVTAYHTSRRKERQLLRKACENEIYD